MTPGQAGTTMIDDKGPSGRTLDKDSPERRAAVVWVALNTGHYELCGTPAGAPLTDTRTNWWCYVPEEVMEVLIEADAISDEYPQ